MELLPARFIHSVLNYHSSNPSCLDMVVPLTRTLSARLRRWQRRGSYSHSSATLSRLTENDYYRPYVYPGLLRMSQERAITIDMRCPASLHRGSTSCVNDTCVICLDGLRPGCDIVRTLPCKHFFHSKCKRIFVVLVI